ncbi:TPA: restriction endonuclease subunit S, partial [Staphylococcus aureus]|nr:restriction endonuclease subunit S [Staphylococcus aureus]
MSNTQKKNAPELRFPEFEGEWKEKKLEDTLEFIKDGTHGTHENVNNGPWLLSAKNIKNNKIIISSDDRKISESDYKKIYKNYKLEKGDLLLTIVGTIGRAAIVKNPNNIAFQRSVAILKTKATYDVGFIFQLFQTKYFKNLLLRKQVVSAQPGLYLGDIRKIKISITNIIEEQRKIGIFFSKLDRQIELEEQKLELLQQQKKGYMQKIFSQELRFKDENGNDYPKWEEKKIEDIASQVYGGGTPNTKIKEFWNGDIPWIQSSDVKVNDLILQQCNKFISKNSIELSSAKLIPANSIAIVTRVGVGKLCLVEFDYATSQDFLSLSSLKYDKLYSLYSLLYTMKKISANLQGTSIKGITKKELLDSIIKIPHNLEEQQ